MSHNQNAQLKQATNSQNAQLKQATNSQNAQLKQATNSQNAMKRAVLLCSLLGIRIIFISRTPAITTQYSDMSQLH
jgi:hypothetical protein